MRRRKCSTSVRAVNLIISTRKYSKIYHKMWDFECRAILLRAWAKFFFFAENRVFELKNLLSFSSLIEIFLVEKSNLGSNCLEQQTNALRNLCKEVVIEFNEANVETNKKLVKCKWAFESKFAFCKRSFRAKTIELVGLKVVWEKYELLGGQKIGF